MMSLSLLAGRTVNAHAKISIHAGLKTHTHAYKGDALKQLRQISWARIYVTFHSYCMPYIIISKLQKYIYMCLFVVSSLAFTNISI